MFHFCICSPHSLTNSNVGTHPHTNTHAYTHTPLTHANTHTYTPLSIRIPFYDVASCIIMILEGILEPPSIKKQYRRSVLLQQTPTHRHTHTQGIFYDSTVIAVCILPISIEKDEMTSYHPIKIKETSLIKTLWGTMGNIHILFLKYFFIFYSL